MSTRPGIPQYLAGSAAPTPTTILDCGHVLTSPTSRVPGYARDNATDATMCYPCADARERVAFRQAGEDGKPFVAYVSSAGDLTTWTGGILARGIAYMHGVSRSGWHGSEVHSWRFDGGREWYGRNGGPGMVITVRRARSSAR